MTQPYPASPAQPKLSLRSDAGAVACLVVLALVFFAPYFAHFDRVNARDDWLQHAARHATVRLSLARYGQFPLRTHWLGGGYPTLWNPEDPTLSPLVLVTLVCGEVAGLKLIGCGIYLVGVIGVYLLVRGVYGHSRLAAGAAVCVVAFSSWTSTRVYKGNLNELYFLCYPLALWLLAATSSRRGFVALALLMAALATDGKLTWLSMMGFLGLASLRLCHARAGRLDLTCALRFGVLALVVLLLAAPKLAPVAEMFAAGGGPGRTEIARHGDHYGPDTIEAFSLGDVWHVFTRPVVGAEYEPSPDNVSLPVLLAAGAGLALCGWRLWADALIALAALLLVMAYHAPVDVFRALTTLPGLSTFSVPAKYFDFYLLLFVALMVAEGVGWAQDRLRGRPRGWRMAAGVLLAIGVGYEWAENRPLLAGLFRDDLPRITPSEDFVQVHGIRMKTTGKRTLHSNNYYGILRGWGTIDCFTAIPLPAYAEPNYFVDPEDRLHPNPRFRGNAYALRGRAEVPVRVTPNRIWLRVSLAQPDRIIINQNFSPHWRSSAGAVCSHNGRLAVDVPAGAQTTVRLDYAPRSFAVGVGLFVVGVLGLAAAAVWLRPFVVPLTPAWVAPAACIGLAAAALWAWLVVAPAMARDRAYLAGLSASRRGDTDAAIAHFKSILAQHPRHAAALLACGSACLRAGKTADAIALLRKAVEARPRSARAALALAEAESRAGDIPAAIEVLRGGTETMRFERRLWFALARRYAMAHRPGEAVAALERAIDLGAGDAARIAGEPAFASLQAEPAFQRLLSAKRLARLLY